MQMLPVVAELGDTPHMAHQTFRLGPCAAESSLKRLPPSLSAALPHCPEGTEPSLPPHHVTGVRLLLA